MSVHVSMAYRLLERVVVLYRLPAYDVGVIRREAGEADAELEQDERLFHANIARLHDALLGGGGGALTEALVLLRGSALNIASIMSNLADEIEAIVIADRDR